METGDPFHHCAQKFGDNPDLANYHNCYAVLTEIATSGIYPLALSGASYGTIPEARQQNSSFVYAT